MRFAHSFSALLSFVLLAQNGLALPLDQNAGAVHLPLKRVAETDGVHPLIALQKRINRNHQRLARMTGWEQPSVEELRENLRKRIVILDEESQSGALSKRHFWDPIKIDASNLKPIGAPIKESFDATSGNNAAVDKNAPPITPAGPPTAQNSLGLDIELSDVGYMVTIQLGTPPRDFLLLADSGSGDTWVGSENCKSVEGGNCGNHRFLGPASSSSFVDTNQPFAVKYGLGSVNGSIVTDNMKIGSLTLDKHTLGVATIESSEFAANDTPFDGIMGLGFTKLSKIGSPTPIEALASKGAVTKPIVSYKLSRLADGKNDGQISFGGLDPTKFDNKQLATVENLSNTGFWEAAMPIVTVDGKDLGFKSRTAILDTGTTLITAPSADARALHTAIPGAKVDSLGGFTVPCLTTASVAMTFGTISFAIDPRDIVRDPIDSNNPNGDCQSGIQSGRNGGPPQWLLGDVFLKNAYFSTDVSTNRITLAKLL